jgi:hypothetical protein
VHPVGRQPVQLAQASAAPRAGRDDRGRRREDVALARLDGAGVAVGRAVAQRHVHEHDLPQPVRLRHERLRGGRRDQPVEQDHRAVRDPPDGAREGGVARRAEPREGVGDRMLVHRPAELGEASADAAVVGVAAARAPGVVDALGDDDVDVRHSARS